MPKRSILPVIICASEEWINIKKVSSPYSKNVFVSRSDNAFSNIIYFYSGCGKTNAAACTQFIISTFSPNAIINIGTCAGVKESVNLNELYIIKSAFYYDYTQIFGNELNSSGRKNTIHKDGYVKNINIKWLRNYKLKLKSAVIASADSDADPKNIRLKTAIKNKAVCFDWESTSIAKICKLNKTNLLILRGISDYIGESGDNIYIKNTSQIISKAITIVRNISKIY